MPAGFAESGLFVAILRLPAASVENGAIASYANSLVAKLAGPAIVIEFTFGRSATEAIDALDIEATTLTAVATQHSPGQARNANAGVAKTISLCAAVIEFTIIAHIVGWIADVVDAVDTLRIESKQLAVVAAILESAVALDACTGAVDDIRVRAFAVTADTDLVGLAFDASAARVRRGARAATDVAGAGELTAALHAVGAGHTTRKAGNAYAGIAQAVSRSFALIELTIISQIAGR
ncbi:MAG: hypothetical protein AB7G88_06520 [Thermomicrobiales bacterium]